uniref:Uncharacterized protein n=1 Tax=Arundo donax TaxID=35708 RepID=A0A0A9DQE3_ARUDO
MGSSPMGGVTISVCLIYKMSHCTWISSVLNAASLETRSLQESCQRACQPRKGIQRKIGSCSK